MPQMAAKTPKVIKLIFVAIGQRPAEAEAIAYKNSFRTCGVAANSWIRHILNFVLFLPHKSSKMTQQDRVTFVINTLKELYPTIPIPLNHKDPYTLLIAVLLSAQCTDVRVNQITPILFAKADNPYDMIKMTVEEIKEIIRPCGLSPMKSKGIHGLSQILIDKHYGQVPQDFEALEALPAVGHKTASVVMSQAFGVPAFPVDTHIHRLMYRWNFTNGKNVVQTEKDAKRLFPKELWNDLHLQIIWYGREYSPARGFDLEKDIITKTIGRKSFLKELTAERTSKKK
jgi:endonuclease-3